LYLNGVTGLRGSDQRFLIGRRRFEDQPIYARRKLPDQPGHDLALLGLCGNNRLTKTLHLNPKPFPRPTRTPPPPTKGPIQTPNTNF
jgi:hypothetical protein